MRRSVKNDPTFPTPTGLLASCLLLLLAAPLAAAPELAYSTYLGAPRNDFGWDVAFDVEGNAYVVGCTDRPPILDFPFVEPAGNFFQGGAGLGEEDAFVTKFSPSGEVVYSAVLGGPEFDCGRAIAVDAEGRAVLVGSAGSFFPLVDPVESYQANTEAFVAVLDPTGTELVFSTYLSGDEVEFAEDVALGGDGGIYVTGLTSSDENSFVPTSPTFDDTYNGGFDGFLAKLDHENVLGPRIVFKTFLGTPGFDAARALALDGEDNILLVGETNGAAKFENAPAPLIQTMPGGGFDAFVLRINSGGFGSAFFSWLGGADFDGASDVAVATTGEILVAGSTASETFPTRNPLQSFGGATDAFLARVATAGNELRSSTFWGGFMFDSATALAIGPSGDVALTGFSDSANLPITDDAIQRNIAGFEDVFVTRFTPEIDDIVFSTWLGGGELDLPGGAAFYGERLGIAGESFSSGTGPFPVTDDAVLGSAPTPYNAFFSVIEFEDTGSEGEIHPADPDGDRRIDLDEVTAYAAAWKTGASWPVPPSPIPIDYLTNAASIWKRGEAYVDTGDPKPGGWQPGG